MKKILLTILMLIASVPLWAQTVTLNGVKYSYGYSDSKGYYAEVYDIVSIPSSGAITIPSGITHGSNVYTVKTVTENSFADLTGLKSVSLPSTITRIKYNAFYNCSDLEQVNIPSGVTSIGTSTFQGCSSLTSIDIPSGVTSIGSSAFQGCNYRLTSNC